MVDTDEIKDIKLTLANLTEYLENQDKVSKK